MVNEWLAEKVASFKFQVSNFKLGSENSVLAGREKALTEHHKGDIVVPMARKTRRLSVALDHALLAEARRLTRSRTKRATIAKALEELVKLEHRKALAHAVGTGVFETTEAEFRSRRRRMHARR